MSLTRSERDAFVATTDQNDLAYGESACLETPPGLFTVLDREFKFDVDLTANEQNHKCDTWFGPGSAYHDAGFNSFQDALTCNWNSYPHRIAVGFSNPPYGAFVPKILSKAVQEYKQGFTSVFLLPVRISGWYRDLVLPFADEVRHIPRVKFWYKGVPKLVLNKRTGQMEHMQAIFDSMIVVYRPYTTANKHLMKRHTNHHGSCPHFSYWDWRKAA